MPDQPAATFLCRTASKPDSAGSPPLRIAVDGSWRDGAAGWAAVAADGQAMTPGGDTQDALEAEALAALLVLEIAPPLQPLVVVTDVDDPPMARFRVVWAQARSRGAVVFVRPKSAADRRLHVGAHHLSVAARLAQAGGGDPARVAQAGWSVPECAIGPYRVLATRRGIEVAWPVPDVFDDLGRPASVALEAQLAWLRVDGLRALPAEGRCVLAYRKAALQPLLRDLRAALHEAARHFPTAPVAEASATPQCPPPR